MSINFNPNGGDLGRAKIKITHPLEFHVVIPHIANILEELYNSEISDLPYKYAFEFLPYYKDMILMEMKNVKLPPHVTFYEVDNKNLFEMRGASGGVVSGFICYMITKD